MKLMAITIENLRQFSHLEIVCASRLNVFVGENGAGKSTVLEAIALFLSWYVARLRGGANTNGHLISQESIRYGTSVASISGVCEAWRQEPFRWRLVRAREGVSKDVSSSFEALNAFVGAYRERGTIVGSEVVFDALPMVALYSTRRVVLDIPLKIRTHHAFRQLETYDGALDGGTEFRAFFEWFRAREDLENEQLRDDDNAQSDVLLAAVRKAMSAFLPGFMDWRIRRQPLRMTVRKPGVADPVVVNQLSDGEKCLLAMVGDLARRLAMANLNAEDPLLGEGIVLIDEVELHLHPAWQKDILPRLLETFPNVQFFVTTHSPLVLSQLNVELLKRQGSFSSEASASPIQVFALQEGKLASLIDPETGLIGASAMDEAAEAVEAAFDALLEEMDNG